MWVARYGDWLTAWPNDPDDYPDGVVSLVKATWQHLAEQYPDNIEIQNNYRTMLSFLGSLETYAPKTPTPETGIWSRFRTWMRS